MNGTSGPPPDPRISEPEANKYAGAAPGKTIMGQNPE